MRRCHANAEHFDINFLSREMRYYDNEMKKFHPQFSSFRVVNNRR